MILYHELVRNEITRARVRRLVVRLRVSLLRDS